MFYAAVYKIDFGLIICLENHVINSSTFVSNEKKKQSKFNDTDIVRKSKHRIEIFI